VSIVLVIQHAEHMCHIVRLYDIFPHYPLNSMIFGKRLLKMCVFDFLYRFFSEIFLILRRIQQGIVVNVQMCLCKVSIILLKF